MRQAFAPVLCAPTEFSTCDPRRRVSFHRAVTVNYHAFRSHTATQLRLLGSKRLLVVADSGGFQAARLERARHDPAKVIVWQAAHADRGLIFDVPPYRYTGGPNTSALPAKLRRQRLQATVDSVHRARPVYERLRDITQTFRWWGVLHGQTPAQLKAWYDAVSAVYPFTDEGEGWAVAPKAAGDRKRIIARLLRFCVKNGVRRLHLLQVSDLADVVVAMALALTSGRVVELTYDSSSPLVRVTKRGNDVLASRKGLGSWRYVALEEYEWDCACWACREQLQDTRPIGYNYYLVLHNTLAMARGFDEVWEVVRSDPEAALREAAGKHYEAVMAEWRA